MRILLDTHVLIWALVDPSRLPNAAVDAISDMANEVFFSPVNLWEIAIKFGLDKPGFLFEPGAILTGCFNAGFTEMPLFSGVVVEVARLPQIHADPFDRLLIFQARMIGARLYTLDRQLPDYGEPVEFWN